MLDSVLHPKWWYFILVSHARVQSFTRNMGTCQICIDVFAIFTRALHFPQVISPLRHAGIGGPVEWSPNSPIACFLGQMSAVHFFSETLSSEQVQILFSYGPNCTVIPLLADQKDHWLKSLVSHPLSRIVDLGSALVITISSKLIVFGSDSADERTPFLWMLFAYHPLRLEEDGCLNTSPYTSQNQAQGTLFSMHGVREGDLQVTISSDIREIIHCVVGGVMVLIPLFAHLEDLLKNRHDNIENVLILLFETLAKILSNNPANQRTMLQSHGFSIIGHLLAETSCDLITTRVVSSLRTLVAACSWMDHAVSFHSSVDTYPNPYPNDSPFPDTRRRASSASLSASASTILSTLNLDRNRPRRSTAFGSLNDSLDSRLARLRTLFNDAFIHILFNFPLWTKKGIDHEVKKDAIKAATDLILQQPAYFRSLIPIDSFIHLIRRYYPYICRTIGDGDEDTMEPTWGLRRMWYETVVEMVVQANPNETVFDEDVTALVQLTTECAPLDCAETLEILAALLWSGSAGACAAVYRALKDLGFPQLCVSVLEDAGEEECVRVAVLHLIGSILQFVHH
eukprot:468293_1